MATTKTNNNSRKRLRREEEEEQSVSEGEDNNIVVDQNYIDTMIKFAREHDSIMAFTPGYTGMTKQLERDVQFYLDGRSGTIPKEWRLIINMIESNQRDVDYQSYSKLEEKLQPKIQKNFNTIKMWTENYTTSQQQVTVLPTNTQQPTLATITTRSQTKKRKGENNKLT